MGDRMVTGSVSPTPARRLLAALAALTVLAALCPPAWAQGDPGEAEDEMAPRWEIGFVGGGGWVPHYPAADQGQSVVAGTPFFVYRWERVRIGEGGLVSGRVFRSPRVNLTMSIGGSLPARSNDNRAREGMPDLEALAEIGPQLEVTLSERPKKDSWKLKLPLRAVVSFDFWDLDYRGMVFKPRLAYTREGLFGSDLRGSLSAGPIFASDLLMDYFYDVPPQYATPDRPAYEADGGYLGSTLNLGLSYPVNDRLRIYVGGQAGYYGGARNRNSPLFRDPTTFSYGAGLVWKIWVSDEMVRR